MRHFAQAELDAALRVETGPWVEFQRSDSMSTGVYTLGVGMVDEQVPHNEDEIYVVVRGKASFVASDRRVEVNVGDVLFVPARQEHRFVDIVEDLVVVVVFAPAETPTED